MKKKRETALLSVLVLLVLAINYPFLDRALINFLDDSQGGIVQRVIDGDTIVINGTSIRMLGINTPEKGEFYYKEAKDFLNGLVLNKTVVIKFGRDRTDKYGRTLGYIFLGDENINKRMIHEGFANYYFPSGKDSYYEEFVSTWEGCLKEGKNLCKASEEVCRNCITINSKGNFITLKNACSFKCNLTNWELKNEGRKKANLNQTILGYSNEITLELPLTSSGDTLFLKDSKGNFVASKSLWK